MFVVPFDLFACIIRLNVQGFGAVVPIGRCRATYKVVPHGSWRPPPFEQKKINSSYLAVYLASHDQFAATCHTIEY